MNEHEWLAKRFEDHRTHLEGVAYRILGSASEADDAVQEAWLRLSRSDTSDVENLGGWLTTVVARVCLDMLRSRTSRREEAMDTLVSDPLISHEDAINPEQEALLADSVGLALLVVLKTLAPAERVAFVLHDLFGVSFDEIAPIVGRSPTAARQLASRARRRVQGVNPDSDADHTRQRAIVSAFRAASRDGDFDTLLTLLDPEVVLRRDATVVAMGVEAEVWGAQAVAGTFSGRAQRIRLALVDGTAGMVWAPGGQPRIVFSFTITDGKIVAIDTLADPERLAQLEIEIRD